MSLQCSQHHYETINFQNSLITYNNHTFHLYIPHFSRHDIRNKVIATLRGFNEFFLSTSSMSFTYMNNCWFLKDSKIF